MRDVSQVFLNKVKRVVAIALLSGYFTLATHAVSAQSTRSPEIVPGTVEIDTTTKDALHKAIQEAQSIFPVEVHYFAVTDITKFEKASLVSIAGMVDYKESWGLSDVTWVGSAIVQYSNEGARAGINGTKDFSQLLSQISESELSEESKSELDSSTAIQSGTTSPEIPRFPWETYFNMQYGMSKVHANGFIAGWQAVDFLSDGNTSAGHAPNKLLASLSGAIDYVCRDGTSVAIRIDNFFYSHLIDNANLVVGKSFAQGDYIAQLKPGVFSDTCGNANQQAGTFHVHWGFPDLATLEVAGWVLNTTTEVWTNGSQTKNVYDWIYANRTYCTGPVPTDFQVMVFSGLNYCGTYTILEMGNYPDSTSMGVVDNSITSIRVGSSVKATTYRDNNYGGVNDDINNNDFDLRDNAIGNDTISSIKIISTIPSLPNVISIVRASSNPSYEDIVDFTVTFSEFVSNVDGSDFLLTTTGSISGASIVQIFDSDFLYTVRVNTGSGNGTIRLDVLSTANIIDASGNLLTGLPFSSGQTFTIVKPTFSDVPLDGFAWAQIESIYTAGITGGCSTNPLNYCPNNSVTRAQMAVFLLRGIHGSAYSPPTATGTVFTDVPSDAFAAAWIEQMVAEGITSGCGNGNYCPNSTVTRAQMAVFLLRAKYGSAYSPPAATGTVFADVPSNGFAAAFIEQLVSEGITSGCGGGNYCPNSSVTRAQMAVFLQRTFNLPLQ